MCIDFFHYLRPECKIHHVKSFLEWPLLLSFPPVVTGTGLVSFPMGLCSVEELVSPSACLLRPVAAGHGRGILSAGHHRETALQYHVSVSQCIWKITAEVKMLNGREQSSESSCEWITAERDFEWIWILFGFFLHLSLFGIKSWFYSR